MIGIPCWQDSTSNEIRSRFVMYQTYVQALAAAGAAPVIIPLSLDQDANQTLFARLDNVLDKHYELVADYNTAGASVFAGVRYAY